MKVAKKVVNKDTLELEEVMVEVEDKTDEEKCGAAIQNALGCYPEEFANSYFKYKEAEKEFKKLYEPFKENLVKLYKDPSQSFMPNSVIIGGVKLTYVSPSTRTSIDTKKLKEEEPELAKKFSKTTNVDATIRLEGPIS